MQRRQTALFPSLKNILFPETLWHFRGFFPRFLLRLFPFGISPPFFSFLRTKSMFMIDNINHRD
jgi:hypothetical protein